MKILQEEKVMQNFCKWKKVAVKIWQVKKSDVKFLHLRKVMRNFHIWERWCEIHFSSWCSYLQMAITSSFQLWFAHYLKHWTPDFPSFEMIYSMCIMDSRKCSKIFLQLLSFWISHSMWRFRIAMRNCFMLDFSLWFSSLHTWLIWKRLWSSPKLGFFM